MAKRRPAIDRLMEKVEIDPETCCWVWQGARSGRGWNAGGGYSAFYFEGRVTSGHRASYSIHNGPIPPGLTIDHLCRNTLCVNPAHLEAVTDEVNNLRGDGIRGRHARSTHCPAGHPYDEANTYRRPDGKGRECRRCRCAVVQRNKAKKLRAATDAT
jgi:hypothetical protein